MGPIELATESLVRVYHLRMRKSCMQLRYTGVR